MIEILNPLRDFSVMAVMFRVILAVICGGLIGLEREYKHRPAGFRTHILICLGAAMTTLTSQYLVLEMHYYTDMARLGAQVIAGVGFIGAGTIVVTRKQRVKGLTTAAGLWASAIIGLALGAGFYEAGVLSTLLILVAELYFSRIEYRFLEKVQEITLFVEYSDRGCIEPLFSAFQNLGLKVISTETLDHEDLEKEKGVVLFSLQSNRKIHTQRVIRAAMEVEGVQGVDLI